VPGAGVELGSFGTRAQDITRSFLGAWATSFFPHPRSFVVERKIFSLEDLFDLSSTHAANASTCSGRFLSVERYSRSGLLMSVFFFFLVSIGGCHGGSCAVQKSYGRTRTPEDLSDVKMRQGRGR
jgi:hypothetical protein